MTEKTKNEGSKKDMSKDAKTGENEAMDTGASGLFKRALGKKKSSKKGKKSLPPAFLANLKK